MFLHQVYSYMAYGVGSDIQLFRDLVAVPEIRRLNGGCGFARSAGNRT